MKSKADQTKKTAMKSKADQAKKDPTMKTAMKSKADQTKKTAMKSKAEPTKKAMKTKSLPAAAKSKVGIKSSKIAMKSSEKPDASVYFFNQEYLRLGALSNSAGEWQGIDFPEITEANFPLDIEFALSLRKKFHDAPQDGPPMSPKRRNRYNEYIIALCHGLNPSSTHDVSGKKLLEMFGCDDTHIQHFGSFFECRALRPPVKEDPLFEGHKNDGMDAWKSFWEDTTNPFTFYFRAKEGLSIGPCFTVGFRSSGACVVVLSACTWD